MKTRWWLATAWTCILLGLVTPASAEPGVAVKPLPYPTSVQTGSHTARVLGLLQLTNKAGGNPEPGGLSDIAWDEDEQRLYAISDHGTLFHFRPIFDNERLVDLQLITALPLYTLLWNTPVDGKHRDAEGLEVINAHNGIKGDTELLISFERNHRVMRYRPDGKPLQILRLPPPLHNRKNYHGKNKSLESVTLSPTLGILTAAEFPLDDAPDYFSLFSLSGSRWLIPAPEDTGLVAMQALGKRNLLLLEREWKGMFAGITTRLSRVHMGTGKMFEPETLLQFGPLDGIPTANFEGLTKVKGNRFLLISDDNYSPFLRTLLLYVELDLQ